MQPATRRPQSSAPFADSITITATAAAREGLGGPGHGRRRHGRGDLPSARREQAIDLLRTLPGLELVRAGSRRQGDLAVLARHQLEPHPGAVERHRAQRPLSRRLRLVDARRPTASNGSRSCVGLTRRSTARARSVVSCSSSPGVAATGGPISAWRASRAARTTTCGVESLPERDSALSPSTSAGHLRRGEGEVENDFYDGEEVDLALDGALGESARLGALLRWGASDLGIPFDYAGQPAPLRRQTFETASLAVPFSWTRTSWHVDAQAARTATDLELRDPGDPFAASTRGGRARPDARRPCAASFATSSRSTARRRLGSPAGPHPGRLRSRHRRPRASAPGPPSGNFRWRHGPLRVDAGVRRDDNDAFGAETSVKAGARLGASPTPGDYGRATVRPFVLPPSPISTIPVSRTPTSSPRARRATSSPSKAGAGRGAPPWRYSRTTSTT